jgi:hypothetical protein
VSPLPRRAPKEAEEALLIEVRIIGAVDPDEQDDERCAGRLRGLAGGVGHLGERRMEQRPEPPLQVTGHHSEGASPLRSCLEPIQRAGQLVHERVDLRREPGEEEPGAERRRAGERRDKDGECPAVGEGRAGGEPTGQRAQEDREQDAAKDDQEDGADQLEEEQRRITTDRERRREEQLARWESSAP